MDILTKLESYYGGTETFQGIADMILDYKFAVTKGVYSIDIQGDKKYFFCTKCNKYLLITNQKRHLVSKHHNRIFVYKEVYTLSDYHKNFWCAYYINSFLFEFINWLIFSEHVRCIEDWRRNNRKEPKQCAYIRNGLGARIGWNNDIDKCNKLIDYEYCMRLLKENNIILTELRYKYLY